MTSLELLMEMRHNHSDAVIPPLLTWIYMLSQLWSIQWMILFCDLSPLTISFITSNVVVACSLSDWCENKTIRSELDKFDLRQNKHYFKKMKGITDYNSRYCRILKKVHTSRYQVDHSRLQFLYSPFRGSTSTSVGSCWWNRKNIWSPDSWRRSFRYFLYQKWIF